MTATQKCLEAGAAALLLLRHEEVMHHQKPYPVSLFKQDWQIKLVESERYGVYSSNNISLERTTEARKAFGGRGGEALEKGSAMARLHKNKSGRGVTYWLSRSKIFQIPFALSHSVYLSLH